MHSFQNYCKDYENIENYDKAKADNFKGWCCHHRLQTWTSDGERRLVDISAAELKALGMYYNRPPEELIFLTESEHHSLHNKGESNPMYGKQGYWKGKTGPNKDKQLSEETKNKISYANKGKQLSEEHKNKLSEAHKGKHHSEEAKKKMSEARKGKTKSEETRKRMSDANKGMRWFNNGEKCVRAKECPEGFVTGRLLIK